MFIRKEVYEKLVANQAQQPQQKKVELHPEDCTGGPWCSMCKYFDVGLGGGCFCIRGLPNACHGYSPDSYMQKKMSELGIDIEQQ